MKKLLLGIFFVLFSLTTWAQSTTLRGVVVDATTQQPLFNATANLTNTNLSATTNELGEFTISNPTSGSQVLLINFTGYLQKRFVLEIAADADIDLGTIYLEEDVTTEQQLSLITLTESDLGDDNSGSETTSGLLQASRDAFQQAAAFNWGQARFRVRSLDNEYGNTFINGISMNKIYDGRPQYSNWGGLNDATRNQEFIHGSMPNDYTFGGILGVQAINTRASFIRTGTRASISGANTNYNGRVMLTHGSGMKPNGWAYAASASYRMANEGFFEGTDYDAKSFFLAVEKKINNNHSLNLSAIYAQNRRGKNSPNTQEVIDLMGYRYNSYWGTQDGKKRNSRDKDVEEPIFILSHYWNISEKTTLNTNVAYQFGKISNTRLDYNGANNPDPTYYKNLPSYSLNYHNISGTYPIWTPDYEGAEARRINFLENSQINWERLYRENLTRGFSVNALYADVMQDNQLTANTLLNTQISNVVSFNAGLTYRNLRSENYQEMLDLLGGGYLLDSDSFLKDQYSDADLNNPDRKVYEGDRYGYNYIMHANVVDLFTQFGFNFGQFDFYLGQNASYTEYQREGLYRNGLYADSSYGKGQKLSFENYGFKGGASYKLTGQHIFDINASYYTKAPSIRNSYSNARISDATVDGLSNEQVFGSDISYIIRTPKLKGRIGAYFNQIKDATEIAFFYADGIDVDMGDDTSSDFVSEVTKNVSKQSMGIEFGAEYQVTPTIKLTAAANYGQAIYNDNADVYLNVDSRVENGLNPMVNYGTSYIKNYRIAGSPQQAYSLGIEYRDPNYWWIGANANFLTDLYLDVSPLLRTNNFFAEPGQAGAAFTDVDANVARNLLKQEKLDDIFLVNVQGGKSWRIKNKTFGFFASINNVLGLEYKTGGFEQSRNANYRELLMDYASGTRSFGPKYFHGYGRTYFVNLYINF
ncbi:MAG: carboxypeptidase-like regulatory domain-containing protein [Myroides sp.]|nr:TonB-dependent receptor [Myroides sp.]MDO5635701.1 carboxypeptidase-like regulatory domain-containing protein [Myroides sp.]